MRFADTRAAAVTLFVAEAVLFAYWAAVLLTSAAICWIILTIHACRWPIVAAILGFLLWQAWRSPGWAEVFGL